MPSISWKSKVPLELSFIYVYFLSAPLFSKFLVVLFEQTVWLYLKLRCIKAKIKITSGANTLFRFKKSVFYQLPVKYFINSLNLVFCWRISIMAFYNKVCFSLEINIEIWFIWRLNWSYKGTLELLLVNGDRLVCIVVSMSDYWSWGRGFNPRHFHKF